MPACFTLTRKGESQPADLQEVDDLMRIEFGEEPDEDRWLWGWYDTIGYGLALGRDWTQLREQFAEDSTDSMSSVEFCCSMLRVIDWLDEHYVPNSWAE